MIIRYCKPPTEKMGDNEFANQIDVQLGVMLVTTLFFFISSFFATSHRDSFIKILFHVIQVAFSYITVTTISALLIASNQSPMTEDTIPWWFVPWWVISEILFVLNLLVFIICYFCGIYPHTPTDISKRPIYILFFSTGVIMILQTLFVIMLMFFLCSPDQC